MKEADSFLDEKSPDTVLVLDPTGDPLKMKPDGGGHNAPSAGSTVIGALSVRHHAPLLSPEPQRRL
jgi:hypothetical protein